MKLEEIIIRDPFIVLHDGRYYMYGTTTKNYGDESLRFPGFYCHVSDDLKEFSAPQPVFVPDGDFWATKDFWAAEVHKWKGAFYLFGSLKADGVCRGTQIFKADHPLGPFVPISDGPVTPRDWECLDGTLFVDDDGRPWIVFCHEWVQIHDGTICTMPLSDDLTKAVGKPVTLFSASQCPWVVSVIGEGNYVTDGPFMFRQNGKLCMFWSSFQKEKGYAMGVAVSESGLVTGPWKLLSDKIFDENGGHGMMFTTKEGSRVITLHAPNSDGPAHPKLLLADELLDFV